MTTRQPPASSTTGSPSPNLNPPPAVSATAPPIRLRHPLPAPPLPHASRQRSLKSPSSSSSSTTSTSHRYGSPSTSPCYYYSSSHPSPAPSNSSGSSSHSSGSAASSSLRTPPDLLVNGASVGHSGKPQLGGVVNSWNGQLVRKRSPRWLRREEIVRRKALLDGLAEEEEEGGGEAWSLPSPPASPKVEPAARKRRRSDSSTPPPPTDTAPALATTASQPRPPPPPPPPPTTTTTPPPPTSLPHLASCYRTLARALKHSADSRTSPPLASYTHHRPHPLSALEQLDSLLLFCHSFYLDDLSSSSTIVKNWTSLFGLLRYTTNAHSDLGNDVLLGVCRCLEAAVLRRLHAYDSKLLIAALPDGGRDEIASMVKRQSADLERAERLWSQARNLLSIANMQLTHPQLLQYALASTVPCTEAAARHVQPGTGEQACSFAWPIDACSPIPFLVAFGRRAVAESGRSLDADAERFVLRIIAA